MQSRREFLKTGTSAISGFAVAKTGLEPVGSNTPGSAAPNFVFFLGEGVRADELSAAGNKIISTPHFDRIVKEGMTFRNAFVVNALCLPSRATLLTGLYSHSTGCIDNRDREIPREIPILPDMLHEAGYEVAFVGKSHVKDLSRRDWDYYCGIEAAGADYYEPMIIEGQRGVAGPPERHEGYVDDVLTDHALAWLGRERSKPFCLFLAFIAPHSPFYRPRRYLDLYDGIRIPKPATFDDDLRGYPGKPLAFHEAKNKIGTTVSSATSRSLEEVVKDHYAGVVANDDCARLVFEALEGAGRMDDTVIVLNSDHGFFLGEWRFYDKRFMHEPSIRVPLSIRYPKLIRPGTMRDEMVLNLDIAPTLLDLAGVKIPEWMQGQSLLPFLKGGEPAVWRKDWLYEYYEYPGANQVRPHRGIRTERYKLIHYYLEPEQFELYDLGNDPNELHNLFGTPSSAGLVAELRNRLDQLRKETGDEFNYETPSGQEAGKSPG